MSLIGHTRQWAALRESQSRFIILKGPAHVGKWKMAETYRKSMDFKEVMRLNLLTMSTSRQAVDFLTSSAAIGTKLVIAYAPNSVRALDPLLKSVEDGISGTLLLLTSKDLPQTIESRAQVIQLGYLKTSEVEKILLDLGVPSYEAEVKAKYAGGVVPPVEAQGGLDRAVSVMRAYHFKDTPSLQKLSMVWSSVDTENLVNLCYAKITGKSEFGSLDSLAVVTNQESLQLLKLLNSGYRDRFILEASIAESWN